MPPSAARPARSPRGGSVCAGLLVALAALPVGCSQGTFLEAGAAPGASNFEAVLDAPDAGAGAAAPPDGEEDYGNHNLEWEDGQASWEEFGHENDPEVCGLPLLTVEEWEAGRHWEGDRPVMVKNVTDGWPALNNWKLQEILRRYPDAEATMGEARLVGAVGPDKAGNAMTPTTVKEFITKHMYNPLKYFFDRKIAIPKGMLEDCHPFPMPTRAYLANPDTGSIYALSKKKKVRSSPDRELWRDHLAISIGSDLRGLSFHHHREAWNVVVFGAKRWILWDNTRFKHNNTRSRRLTRDWEVEKEGVRPEPTDSVEWLRRLYPHPERTEEIRNHGHDCVQRPGEMMFVPERWMHMVVNIGDTVSVISEVGLGIGEGKKPEDFAYDPFESSDDSEDSEDFASRYYGDLFDYSEDGSEDGEDYPPRHYGDRRPGDSEDSSDDSEDYSPQYYEDSSEDSKDYPSEGGEESEKAVSTGIDLLKRLMRTNDSSIRVSELKRHLVPQATTSTDPDGRRIAPGRTGWPLLSHSGFVEALSHGMGRLRMLGAAGDMERSEVKGRMQGMLQVAVEAREVLVESFGEMSGIVEEFQKALQPVFGRGRRAEG